MRIALAGGLASARERNTSVGDLISVSDEAREAFNEAVGSRRIRAA